MLKIKHLTVVDENGATWVSIDYRCVEVGEWYFSKIRDIRKRGRKSALPYFIMEKLIKVNKYEEKNNGKI